MTGTARRPDIRSKPPKEGKHLNIMEGIIMTDKTNDSENREPVTTPEAPSQKTGGATHTPEDIEKNKTMAGLAYLLFFLPLVACPESRYARFHANQGLLLLITGVAGSIILGIIPIVGWILMPIFGLGILALGIIGLLNGFGGKAKELPVVGRFNILK